MLQSPQPASTEGILTSLINEIAAIHDRIVLILDDYHPLEAQPVHDAHAFLLEHQGYSLKSHKQLLPFSFPTPIPNAHAIDTFLADLANQTYNTGNQPLTSPTEQPIG